MTRYIQHKSNRQLALELKQLQNALAYTKAENTNLRARLLECDQYTLRSRIEDLEEQVDSEKDANWRLTTDIISQGEEIEELRQYITDIEEGGNPLQPEVDKLNRLLSSSQNENWMLVEDLRHLQLELDESYINLAKTNEKQYKEFDTDETY